MSLKNPPHIITQRKLMSFFHSHLASDTYLIDKEIPLDISQQTMPEPDIVIARQRPDLWRNEHVRVIDLALVMEVADSILDHDLGPKKDLYARSGVPVYWAINLPERQVHVFSDWRNGQYQITTVYKEGPVPITPFNLKISFDDIFPE